MNASQLMWEEREERRKEGKRKGDGKEGWNWKLIQKSNFRILEAASLGRRTALAKDVLCNME